MLRRKPTALTISPEDLAAFEEAHARQRAYTHYRRTGEDPNGWFTQQQQQQQQQFSHAQYHHRRMVSGTGGEAGVTTAMDPNDELKPLPGDKARIVRSREERIVGGSSSGITAQQQQQQQQYGGGGGAGRG